jgi:hypothetical protein
MYSKTKTKVIIRYQNIIISKLINKFNKQRTKTLIIDE